MRSFICLLLVSVLLLALPLQAKKAEPKLSGTITLSGAFALYPMAIKWAEEFRKIHPDVRIDISAGGAGKGMADVLSKAVDIGMVSREIHSAEIEKGAWFVPVVRDAVVPSVSSANPFLRELKAKGLTRDAFRTLWVGGNVQNWADVVPGIKGAPLHLYTRSDSCGAAETWALYIGSKQEELQGIGVYGDPGIAEAVRKDPLGIAYNNVNYAYDAGSKRTVAGLETLPIDLNGNGKIDPEENFYGDRDSLVKAIADGRYPAPPARDLYFVCLRRPATQLLSTFVAWVMKEGQAYVSETGYIGLSKEKLAAGLKKLQ